VSNLLGEDAVRAYFYGFCGALHIAGPQVVLADKALGGARRARNKTRTVSVTWHEDLIKFPRRVKNALIRTKKDCFKSSLRF
jgi:hypothetical protein